MSNDTPKDRPGFLRSRSDRAALMWAGTGVLAMSMDWLATSESFLVGVVGVVLACCLGLVGGILYARHKGYSWLIGAVAVVPLLGPLMLILLPAREVPRVPPAS